MLDAKSAREKSMVANKGRSDIELERIEREIDHACSCGYTRVDIKGKLHSITVSRLQHMGYKVEFNDDQREGAWTTISW